MIVILNESAGKLAILAERKGQIPCITISRWVFEFAIRTPQAKKCWCSRGSETGRIALDRPNWEEVPRQ